MPEIVEANGQNGKKKRQLKETQKQKERKLEEEKKK